MKHLSVFLAVLMFIGQAPIAQELPPPELDVIVVGGVAVLVPSRRAVAVACGVVVVIGGGIAVYYFYSFCKKYYPKPDTNAPPQFTLTGDNTSMAASTQWFCGYCYNDLSLFAPEWTSAERLVTATVDNGRIGPIQVTREGSTKEEFQAWALTQGVPLDYGSHYAIDGIPCESWQIPITFSSRGDTPTLTINGVDLRTNVVERSHDLIAWTPILTNIAPASLKFVFTDNSEEPQSFYRVRQ